MSLFETKQLGLNYDVIAPDGSEIRLLPELTGGSMAHCQLPVGAVTKAVSHRTVEELWYVLEGRGEIWRKQGSKEEITRLKAGVSISIPQGTIFQFRNIGDLPLQIILVTMPPWTGPDEAIPQQNHWEA
jgi:mannose-6-phosphate isomerase-like protein (cupin superfamily)